MSEGTTYDARVYRTEVYKGKKTTTYHVRWKVGDKLWREGFRTAAQADSFRSALLTAARKGEVFSLATGRPAAWERTKADTTWYEFACLYVDMKWKQASAKYRKDIARALTTATPVMLAEVRGRPDDASIRQALIRWGFNTKTALRTTRRGCRGPRMGGKEQRSGVRTGRSGDGPQDARPDNGATGWEERSSQHGPAEPHHPGQCHGLRDRAGPAGDEPDPADQLDNAQGLQPGGPAQRREPAPSQGAAGGGARPAAERTAAGRLLRGDVLRRAPSRGSDQPQ